MHQELQTDNKRRLQEGDVRHYNATKATDNEDELYNYFWTRSTNEHHRHRLLSHDVFHLDLLVLRWTLRLFRARARTRCTGAKQESSSASRVLEQEFVVFIVIRLVCSAKNSFH
jgi:hypothetical protein